MIMCVIEAIYRTKYIIVTMLGSAGKLFEAYRVGWCKVDMIMYMEHSRADGPVTYPSIGSGAGSIDTRLLSENRTGFTSETTTAG